MFLFESRTSKDCQIDLNGYISNKFFRKLKQNAKRNNGGLVLYYKESLQNGISIVKNIHETMVWIKLDRSFFHLENEAYVCGVYVWGEHSPAYNVIDGIL